MKQSDSDLFYLLASECSKRKTRRLTITQLELQQLYLDLNSKSISLHALNSHLRNLQEHKLITRTNPNRRPLKRTRYFQPTTYRLTKKSIDLMASLLIRISQYLLLKGGD